MKSLSKIGFFLAPLAFTGIGPAFPQAVEDTVYQQWVDYRDGEISVAFAQAPVEVAVNAIRASTGFQIVLPPATESKLLTLRLDRLPLEAGVRSLLSSIGFRNFALIYDEKGSPNRVIVLGALDDRASVASQNTEPAAQPLTAEERDKLRKELERWSELKREDRGRIEDRLKSLPPSEEREQLVKEYGRQILGIKN